ncbi:MAG: hypothetical protein V1799_01530 [bacterium]
MAGKWIEIVELRLEGQRFEGHALTLDVLSELIEYQSLVTKTAVELYKRKHPERERIPRNFEQRTILRFTHIGDGSAVLPLEAYFEDGVQLEVFEEEPVVEAVELTGRTIECLQQDSPLPENLPKNIIPLFGKLGSTLRENEKLHIHPSKSKAVEYTPEVRARILKFAEKSFEDIVDIVGMVGAADVVHNSFQLYKGEGINFPVAFPVEAEETVTTALKEHRSKKLRVRGWGEFNPDGTLKKIVRVDSLEETSDENQLSIEAPSIVDELLSLVADIPEEEIKKLPKDFSSSHDKYLYNR